MRLKEFKALDKFLIKLKKENELEDFLYDLKYSHSTQTKAILSIPKNIFLLIIRKIPLEIQPCHDRLIEIIFERVSVISMGDICD